MSAARRGTRPRGLWAGRHEAEGDGAEQRARRAARRQMNADAGEMLDHARADLDQRSRMVANSHLASGLLRGIAARTPCISQNAAVWRTSRT